MNDSMLELLYLSFDRDLTADERKMLEGALAASEELRREKCRVEAVRQVISASGADGFKPLFAERVIERVRALSGLERLAPTFQEWLFRAFKRVAIPVAAAAVFLVIFNLVQTEGVSLAGAVGMSDITIEEILELPVDSILEEPS